MVPEVNKCTVVECYYNREELCCAHSVLVGSNEPVCETFTIATGHTTKHGEAQVGACHVANCRVQRPAVLSLMRRHRDRLGRQ